MSDVRWQYCQLWLKTLETHGETVKAELSIDYIGDGFVSSLKLSGKDTHWLRNPFYLAIAELGAGGWELVTIEHGHAGGWAAWAFFKRPLAENRRVDQPKLTLGQGPA